MDIGSSEWLTLQNLEVLETAESRIAPKWLFPPRCSNKNRFTVQMLYWLFPSLQEQKTNRLAMKGGWVLKSGRGQLRGTRSTSAAPPAISRSTFPRQHRPKDISILQRDIHLIEVKYCEDTRPQNQLCAAQEQHKGLCTILQGASVILHTILWEWVVPCTTSHTGAFQKSGS